MIKISTLVFLLTACILTLSVEQKVFASVQVPLFRLKAGYYPLKFSAGSRYTNENLGNSITIQPTLLWDLPTFRSRVGLHFISDFQSPFGLMPISGIGISGYFYILGISSAYEQDPGGTLFQKSRPGPFVFGAITPANFNLNRSARETPDGADLSFAAFVMELNAGVGYDYPINNNVIFSGEVGFRSGANQSSSTTTGNVSYSGMGIMLSLSATYY